MTQEQGAGVAAKIQELKSEHRALDQELQNMSNDPTFDDLQIRRLKKRKLFLKDSIWEGRRILPEGWVKESVTPRVELASSKTRYGYKWWLLPYKEGKYAITGLGYGGQRLIIIPDKELIAVFTGWNIYDTPSLNANYALNRLLKAFGPES